MADITYATTRQGVRDLDRPMRREATEINVGAAERAVSMLAGGVMAGFGLGLGGMTGLLFTVGGGALAYRGVTGHCPAYSAAGLNTDH